MNFHYLFIQLITCLKSRFSKFIYVFLESHSHSYLYHGDSWVYHTKVLSGTKKERNQRWFLWSKVFLDKGITNRTIGQSLRVDFPKSKTNLVGCSGCTLVWPQTRLGLIKEMRSSQASIRCNPFPYFTNKTFVASRKQVYIEDPVRNLDVYVILIRKTE